MRHKYHSAVLVVFLLVMLILSSCGSNGQQTKTSATATAASNSKIALITTYRSLIAVNANNGTHLWATAVPGLSPDYGLPLVVSAHRVYYSTDSNVAAVDLASGKLLWSAPISGHVNDLQVSSSMVYVLANKLLSAFDAASGALEWHIGNIDPGAGVNKFFKLSGDTIYTAISGSVTALDATTGSQLWQFTPSALKDSDSSPAIKDLLLSVDGKTLVIIYNISYNGDAIYAVNIGSHQEAWNLDYIATNDFHITYHAMALGYRIVTSDNHLLIEERFDKNTSGLPADGYRYLSLSNGSEAWFLPDTLVGASPIADDRAIYSIGGPSGGDISAITLNNQKQAWNVPSSGSYHDLYLDNDVLLASDQAQTTLTALDTRNGKQLWQQSQLKNAKVFTLGQHIFISEDSQAFADPNLVAIDPHSGHRLWSQSLTSFGATLGDNFRSVIEVEN